MAGLLVLAMFAAVVATLIGGIASDAGSSPSATLRVTTSHLGTNAQTSGELRLLEQTPWVEPNATFAARIQLGANHGPGHVSATVWEALDSGAAVAKTADRGGLGRFRGAARNIEVDADRGTVIVRIPLGEEAGADRVRLDPGVYPVLIEFVPKDQRGNDELVTHLIHLPTTSMAPQRLAIVARIDAPVTWRDGGSALVDSDVSEVVPNLQLLAAAADTPHTVAVTPAVLDALDRPDAPPGITALLATVLGDALVLNQPYVPIATEGWLTAGTTELDVQLDAGARALDAQLDHAADTASWAVTPADGAATLAHVARRGAKVAVVPRDRLRPGDDGTQDAFGSARAVRLEDTQPAIIGLVPTDAQALSAEPVAEVHRLVAAAAVDVIARSTALTDASTSPPATTSPLVPLTVLAERFDDGEREALTLLFALTDPAAKSPILRAVDLESAARNISRDDLPGARIGPAASSAAVTSSQIDQVALIRADVDSYRGAIETGTDNARSAALSTAALHAAATIDDVERQNLASAVRSAIEAELAGIEIARDDVIRVTSSDVDLPLSIRNTSGSDLRLLVELSSTDLEFTGPTEIDVRIPAGGISDLQIPVHLTRSGDFMFSVSVGTPDGRLTASADEVQVRSTAISGAGIVLSVGSLAFLALWWIRSATRKRRSPPADIASPVEPTPTRQPQPVS